jgi:hypothetical protein
MELNDFLLWKIQWINNHNKLPQAMFRTWELSNLSFLKKQGRNSASDAQNALVKKLTIHSSFHFKDNLLSNLLAKIDFWLKGW